MLLTARTPVVSRPAVCHSPGGRIDIGTGSTLHQMVSDLDLCPDHEPRTTIACELEHDHEGPHAGLLQAWTLITAPSGPSGELWIHWDLPRRTVQVAFQPSCHGFILTEAPEGVFSDEDLCTLFAAHSGRCSFDLASAVSPA